jgi:NADH-quinone oxidoreductase subunit C
MTDVVATTDAAEPPSDLLREQVLVSLTEHLGDAIEQHVIDKSDLWVRVRNDSWAEVARICKNEIGFDYFCFLSGIDWMLNPELSGEKRYFIEGDEPATDDSEAEGLATGVAGGASRFQVFARLYNIDLKAGITFKADLDDLNPTVGTWTKQFRGAAWHERETHEMYGFVFQGNDDLRKLYLPGGFEGNPLRKDFPLLAREVKPWPGIVNVEPIPGADDEDAEGGEDA